MPGSLITVDDLLLIEFKTRLYHGTSSAHLDKIQKEGLSGNPEQRVYTVAMNPAPGSVYFASTPKLATKAAVNAHREFGGFPVVLIIEKDLVKPSKKFFADEDALIFLLHNKPGDERYEILTNFFGIPAKDLDKLSDFFHEEEVRRREAGIQGDSKLGKRAHTNFIYIDHEDKLLQKFPWLKNPDLTRYLHDSIRHKGDIKPRDIKEIWFAPSFLYENREFQYKDHPKFERDIINERKKIIKEYERIFQKIARDYPNLNIKKELEEIKLEKIPWVRSETRSILEKTAFMRDFNRLEKKGSEISDFRNKRRYYWNLPYVSTDTEFERIWMLYKPYEKDLRPYMKIPVRSSRR